MISSIGKDINTFVIVCESLLAPGIMPDDLTERERQTIQYYLSALSVKFPALSK
jgi:hypothetical protein